MSTITIKQPADQLVIRQGGTTLVVGNISTGGATTTPGGTNTQIQYNNIGSFGGAAGAAWLSGTSQLQLSVLDTPATPALAFTANDGMYSSVAGNVSVATAGVLRAAVSATAFSIVPPIVGSSYLSLAELASPPTGASSGVGRVYVDQSDNNLYYLDELGSASQLNNQSSPPGGSDTQAQFNNAGVFGGMAGVTWVAPTLTVASTATLQPSGAGVNSTRIGTGSVASGASTVAVGITASAAGDNATAVGHNAQAIAGGVAVGQTADASLGTNATCIGYDTYCDGSGAITIGYFGGSDLAGSIGIGQSVWGGGADCVAVGSSAVAATGTVGRNVAVGGSAAANNDYSIAIGYNAAVDADGAIAIGRDTDISPGDTESIAIGRSATTAGLATSTFMIALGPSAVVNNTHGISLGYQATVSGDSSLAAGRESLVDSASSGGVAIGYLSLVRPNSLNAIAIGRSAAVGSTATGNADYGIAIGNGSLIQDSIANGMALGRSTVVGHATSVALGYTAATTAANQLMIGDPAQVLNPRIHGFFSFAELGSPPAGAEAGFGKLYVKSSDSKLYFLDDGGTEFDLTASGAPGGSDTQIQYNNAGVFGGAAQLTWDSVNNRVSLASSGAAATPTLTFGTNDGIYQAGAADLRVSLAATSTWGFDATDFSGVVNADSPAIIVANSAATTPGLQPARSDPDTGVGWASADILTMVAGGIEGLRIAEAASAVTLTLQGNTITNGYLSLSELITPPSGPDAGFGKIYVKSSDSGLYFLDDGGTEYDLLASGGTPGGIDTQVQYNNGGAFGGMAGVTWDDTGISLAIASTVEITSPGVGALSEKFGANSAAAGADGTAFGESSNASASGCTAIGQNAQATGVFSTAVGNEALCDQVSAVAVGNDAECTAASSVSVGYIAKCQGTNAVAIGRDANCNATGDFGIALGNATDCQANSGIAIGASTLVQSNANDSIAIGRSARAGTGSSQATAIGRDSDALHDGAIALGYLAQTTANYRCTIGTVTGGGQDCELQIGKGFAAWAATPPAAQPVYTVTNDTTDRTYDANSTTIDELADVLATVISDLQDTGIFG